MVPSIATIVEGIAVVIAILAFVYIVDPSLLLSLRPARPNVNFVSFSCEADTDCVLTGVECCNNNAPTQNTCISKDDMISWTNEMKSFCDANKFACAEYYMPGNFSCVCKERRCWTIFTDTEGSAQYTGLFKGK